MQDQVEVAVVSSSGDIEAAFKHLRSLSSNISSPISERKMVWLSANMWILYPPQLSCWYRMYLSSYLMIRASYELL